MLTSDTPIVSFPKSGRTWLRYAAALEDIELTFTHADHASNLEEMGFNFKGIDSTLKGKPVIFLHRNPLDTAVSYFFQVLHKDCVPGRKTWRKMKMYGRLPPTRINDFVLHPQFGIELITTFNRAWLDYLQGAKGSVVFTYEQFHENPEKYFTKFFKASSSGISSCAFS